MDTVSFVRFALVSDDDDVVVVCAFSFSFTFCTPSMVIVVFLAFVEFVAPELAAAAVVVVVLFVSIVSGELGVSDDDGFRDRFRSLNLRTFR